MLLLGGFTTAWTNVTEALKNEEGTELLPFALPLGHCSNVLGAGFPSGVGIWSALFPEGPCRCSSAAGQQAARGKVPTAAVMKEELDDRLPKSS